MLYKAEILLFLSFYLNLLTFSCFVSGGKLGAFSAKCSASSALDRITVREPWMVDSTGRVRIFHGPNSVTKFFPWYEVQTLNKTRLKLFKEWGFNVMRLGTMWSGVEPEKGKYNETYIKILQTIVEEYENYGIYALLDMHQDVLSSKFNTYDGFPLWLVNELSPPKFGWPWPFPVNESKSITWWKGYLTDACSHGFQQIYSNANGSLDHFVNFWKKMATVFKDSTSVIGYELINEPWAGDVWSEPSLFLPGIAGSKNLMPMYEILNKAIRKIDNETLIFYEPVTWSVVFNGKTIGTGFATVPGGDIYRNKSVLSWHYYCWFIANSDDHTKPYPAVEKIACDSLLGPKVFSSISEDLKQLGGASFLTEFGRCSPDKFNSSVDTEECEFVLQQADEHLQSWAYWDSHFFDGGGNINWDVVKALARVYPRAVAGIPQSIRFDSTTKMFKFQYIIDPSIKQATEIFVPLLHYPQGFNVTVSSGLQWNWDGDSSSVRVSPSVGNDHFRHAEALKVGFVTIVPKT